MGTSSLTEQTMLTNASTGVGSSVEGADTPPTEVAPVTVHAPESRENATVTGVPGLNYYCCVSCARRERD